MQISSNIELYGNVRIGFNSGLINKMYMMDWMFFNKLMSNFGSNIFTLPNLYHMTLVSLSHSKHSILKTLFCFCTATLLQKYNICNRKLPLVPVFMSVMDIISSIMESHDQHNTQDRCKK